MHYAHALTCQSSQHMLCVCVDVLSLNTGEEHMIALVQSVFRIVSIVFDGVALKRSGPRYRLYDRLRCVCVPDM